MDIPAWAQAVSIIGVAALSAPIVGRYVASVLSNGEALGDRVFLPIERVIYRFSGVDHEQEQSWRTYAWSLLAFSLVSLLALYALLRLQGSLPFNPDQIGAVPADLAFNIATSFTTNTNWQNYGGESTLSHLSQFAGLVTQNFVSAAAGIGVMAVLLRGLGRSRSATVGNFWVDLTRVTVRLLLPASMVLALILASQGVIQNTAGSSEVSTLEGATQQIPGGPVASQVAIKQLGSNGGGFFNTNSAHPFENPNGLTNWLQTFALVVLPLSAPFTYGEMVGRRRQGRAVFAAMLILWIASVGIAMWAEMSAGASMDGSVVSQEVGLANLEGKESRFGTAASALWAASTTGTSNGSVNAMHGSLTPLAGLVVMANMLLGEVSPGGVGVGLTGMLVFVILTVFIAGLMVGRTPELLGKKIQATEVKLATLYLLVVPTLVLGFTSVAVLLPEALEARTNPGAWGLAEMLYGFASPANNNGSAMAGLGSNTLFYNTTQAVSMLAGRFMLIIPVLAIAGSLARKHPVPDTVGTFRTDTPLFVSLLLGMILVVAGLTYFPVLSLGPIIETLRT